jgi:hypothetical protein
MSDTPNLLKLFNSAPKDEKNRFVADPRTDAFLEALAKSKPLTPPELLQHAERLGKKRSPAAIALARRLFLQAIGDIGHDRRMLEILSKVADERTSWGLSGRELLEKMTKAHQGLSERFTTGTVGFPFGEDLGGGGLVSVALTAPGTGCTYQPPSGPAITLTPKQTRIFISSSELVDGVGVESVITVTCFNLSTLPGKSELCLRIETRTFYFIG